MIAYTDSHSAHILKPSDDLSSDHELKPSPMLPLTHHYNYFYLCFHIFERILLVLWPSQLQDFQQVFVEVSISGKYILYLYK